MTIGFGVLGAGMISSLHGDALRLAPEAELVAVCDIDKERAQKLVDEFAAHFGYNGEVILNHDFIKLFPRWLRPYGRLYTY